MIALVLGILIGITQLIRLLIRSIFHRSDIDNKWLAISLIIVGLLNIFTQIKIEIPAMIIILVIAFIQWLFRRIYG